MILCSLGREDVDQWVEHAVPIGQNGQPLNDRFALFEVEYTEEALLLMRQPHDSQNQPRSPANDEDEKH